MKHLLIALVLLALGYGAWHITPKAERDEGARLIAHHAIRLGALAAVVIALLALAYHATSTPLL